MRKTKTLIYLTFLGLMMVLIPFNSAIVMLLFSLFRHNEAVVETSVEGPSVVYLNEIFPSWLPVTGIALFIGGCIMLGCIICIYHRKYKNPEDGSL